LLKESYSVVEISNSISFYVKDEETAKDVHLSLNFSAL